MSDPIVDILNDYARCWHEACVSWEPEYRNVNEVAEQIRQQIGRELLECESWAVPRHKVVEVCQMEAQSE